MLRIAFVNMPFASAQLPSIAATQLKSVLRSSFGDRVESKALYLNLEFVDYIGAEIYEFMSNSVEANTSGLGDWFFRQTAFPELPDNSEVYLRRHFSEHKQEMQAMKDRLIHKRLHLGTFLEQLIDRYRLDTYDVVGFTSMFSQSVACIAMARRLKQRNPNVITIMGGANCESPMGQVLARNVDVIDFVFAGPSLKTLPQFIGHLLEGEEEKCHQVTGIFSKKKLARQLQSGPHEMGGELDINQDVDLDYDDYLDTLKAVGLAQTVEPNLTFETSRGCWWGERSHCTFCGLNGATMTYRAMEPKKALQHLETLFERYSSEVSVFQSVDNILPREYYKEVLPNLKTPPHVSLFYEIKADIKEHEAAALAKARVTRIQPGIEALATSTLKLMRKGTTSFQNIRFLKYCLTYGISPAWNLLVGFPGEEEVVYAKYVDDLPLLVHLPPPAGVYPVRFDRFSPYYAQAKEYGLKLRPCDFYSMIYPFGSKDIENLAYYFVDENYSADYVRNTAKWLSKMRQRIDDWHSRWSQEDGGLKPEVRFEEQGGVTIVYDSRTGEKVEHHVDPLGEKVLDVLSMAPMKIPRLVAALKDISEASIRHQLAELREMGLIFQERDLYMSLIVKEARLEPGRVAAEELAVVSQEDAVEQFNFA